MIKEIVVYYLRICISPELFTLNLPRFDTGRRTPEPGRRTPDSGRRTPEPQFKNPRLAGLVNKWQHVWLISMERQRKLQDALDYLNEVSAVSCSF